MLELTEVTGIEEFRKTSGGKVIVESGGGIGTSHIVRPRTLAAGYPDPSVETRGAFHHFTVIPSNQSTVSARELWKDNPSKVISFVTSETEHGLTESPTFHSKVFSGELGPVKSGVF